MSARQPHSRRNRGGGKPRLAEVAARAGLAAITVSRALRQPEKVAPHTRARVMAAVEALGYIPNLAASSLASRRSQIIAVIVPTIANSVFAETVQGLADGVRDHGFQLLLGESSYSETIERALLAALIGRQPDGIAFTGVARPDATRRLLADAHVPVVETWDLTDTPIDLLVGFSNEGAGVSMTRYLLKRGYRRIAFIGGRDHRAGARRRGYEAELAKHGLPPAAMITENISYGEGRAALRRLVREYPETDAVFFATDVLAVGGLLECQARAIAVPNRLAIAGLGDLEIAGELTPSLTTVRVPSYAIGRRAAELLLARIAGEEIPERVVDLGFKIVARQSA